MRSIVARLEVTECRGALFGAGVMLAAFVLAPGLLAEAEAQERAPVPVILDTDMESDVDDVGALAMLHALADRGEAEILGVVVSAKNPNATLTADRLNTYFGRPDLPLGQLKGEGVDRESRYAHHIAEEFPGQLASAEDAPDAVALYREILAGQPDNSVVLVTIGYKTNVRDLLASEPCEHSELDGRELAARKFRIWICMGGHFPSGREANILWDARASVEAIENWPTDIIFNGWEIGRYIYTGGGLAELPEDSPVRRSYELFNNLQPHRSWDQAALLYAVRGLDDGPAADYWELSRPGRIVIDPEDGSNTWEDDPEGTHRHHIARRDPELIAEEIDVLMRHLPSERSVSNMAASAPRVFISEGDLLLVVRQSLDDDSAKAPLFRDAVESLRSQADELLDAGPYSVTFKTREPPSGDKHDYLSVGPYWWPNPDTEDGLPFIRRDGDVNPDYRADAYDATAFGRFNRAWRRLALAWYYTRHEPYAEHAAQLLRVWFLEPETRMNPHMRYAQAIPGRNDGRAVGIVEAERLRYLPDAIGMLEESGHWTAADQEKMQAWCVDFLDWMLHSGALERYVSRGGHNNIAIGLDSLVAALALYTDQPDTARDHINRLTFDRVASQIEPDGSLPWELARTQAFGYSIKALDSFFVVARLAEHVDVDLWHYSTPDGRSLRKALDFLLPYLDEPGEWTHEGGVNPHRAGQILLPLAIRAWNDDAYRQAYDNLGERTRTDEERLIYPAFLLD